MTMFKRCAGQLAAVMLLVTLAACGSQEKAAAPDTTQQDVESVRAFLTEIEQSFNGGQIDAFMPMFAEDAILSPQGSPDIVGAAAIRAVYTGAMNQVNMQVTFTTKEISVFGDLAYESGTFTVKSSDKSSAQVLSEVTSRHIHIFRRGADGRWKTWRMMTNSEAAAGGR